MKPVTTGDVAVTFADRVPGASFPIERTAAVDISSGAGPAFQTGFATSSVGPGFFEAFDRPIVAGRGFHGGDFSPAARTVIVNEAFVRGFVQRGIASPLGARLRYSSESGVSAAEPSFEDLVCLPLRRVVRSRTKGPAYATTAQRTAGAKDLQGIASNLRYPLLGTGVPAVPCGRAWLRGRDSLGVRDGIRNWLLSAAVMALYRLSAESTREVLGGPRVSSLGSSGPWARISETAGNAGLS